MGTLIFQYVLFFIVLVLVQVLICNHIILFNMAVPMVFIYFIIRLPISMKTSLVLTLAFLLGLIVDIFSDTPGVNALSCTLLAMSRKPILYAYVSRDDKTKEIIPCISDLGISVYAKFLLTVSFLYCLMVFAIEFFSFADVQDILIMSASSGLLTFLLLLGVDCLIYK